jgi:hypothetical protein
MHFENFPDSCRLWVYNADRQLTSEESIEIQVLLNAFIQEWAAHGNALFGEGKVIDDRFIVLVVDEAQSAASGCSIDTSVRFIKELGAKFNVDFFDRLHPVTENKGEFGRTHISDLSDYPDHYVYNPMVSTLGEWRVNWKVKVSESPFV